VIVYEKTGSFVPSALAQQLGVAGVAVEGVTCTEDADGNVTAVQIICSDDTTSAAVDKVCAAYTPPPAPPEPSAPIAAQLAALTQDQPVTGGQLADIFASFAEPNA
jgi:hypothetical protein